MAIKTEVVLPDGNSIKCKCGKRILTAGKDMRLFIPSVHGECFKCGTTFIFDKLFMDDNKVIQPIKQKKGEEMSILEKLDEGRIFDIELVEGGFEFGEGCDGCFSVVLTRDELLKLIDELKELSEKVKK